MENQLNPNQDPQQQAPHPADNNISNARHDHANLNHPHPRRGKSFPPQISIHALISKLGLRPCKTAFCKHENGCVQSSIQSFIDSFVLGYIIKTGISLVFGLKKVFKNPANLIKLLVSKDSFNFAMFLGGYAGLFKAIICALRRKFPENQNKWIAALSGFIAGTLSILFLQQKTRQNLALFLLARALDTIYNSLINKGIIPKWKYDYVLLYSLMMMITGYCYGNEPGCMTPEMNKFYLSFTNESINDLQMRQIWIERKNIQLAKKGIARQDPLEFMPKLKKYYEKLNVGKTSDSS